MAEGSLNVDASELERWIRARDPEAFRAVVARYSAMVYGTCRRVLGDASEAEDVTQESFEALARVDRVPTTYLGPWLHRVAVNLSLNRLRGNSRRKRREHAYAERQAFAPGPEWDEIYQYVDEAIAALPEKFRAPLVAHFLENRSHGAIAEESGIIRQTITYRVAKGVELVRKTLKRKGVEIGVAALGAWLAEHTAAEAAPAPLLAQLGKIAASGTRAVTSPLCHSRVGGNPGENNGLLRKVLDSRLRGNDAIKTLAAPAAKVVVAGAILIILVLLGMSLGHSNHGYWAVAQPTETSGPQKPLRVANDTPEQNTVPAAAGPLSTGVPSSEEALPSIVAGYVFDAKGKPIPKAMVTAYIAFYYDQDLECHICLRGTLAEGEVHTVLTDHKGWYEIKGLVPADPRRRDVLLVAQNEGFAEEWAPHVPLGKEDANFTLSLSACLRGTVIDADTRAPLPQFQARIAQINTNRYGRVTPDYPWENFENSEGAFEICSGPYEHFEIAARAEGYVTMTSGEIVVAKGTSQEGFLMELRHGYATAGVVVEAATGQPVAGAHVAVFQCEGDNLHMEERQFGDGDAISDAAGQFQLGGLTEEPAHFIAASHPSYPVAFAEIPPPGADSLLRIVMAKGGTLAGTVCKNGEPCSRFRILADLPIGDPRRRVRESGHTDAQGRYLLKDIPPGDYSVGFFDPIIGHSVGFAISHVESGGVTRLDADLARFGSLEGTLELGEKTRELAVGFRAEGFPVNFFKRAVDPAFKIGIVQQGKYEIFAYDRQNPAKPIYLATYYLEPGTKTTANVSFP